MTIRFVCACGKGLRAGDDLANRRVLCPGCGALVGVPSPRPGDGPPPLAPNRRPGDDDKPTAAGEMAAAAIQVLMAGPVPARRRVRLQSGKKPRAPAARTEQHWYDYLLYPLRAWPLTLALAVTLSLLSAGLLVFLPPRLVAAEEAGGAVWPLYASGLAVAALLALLPCTFLERVLASAADGEVDAIVWSGNAFSTFLLAGARWVAAFLAGPAVLAGVAYLYWQRSGDTAWDRAILGELAVVAASYFLLALAAVVDRGRWGDLAPPAVADLAYRLRWRAAAVVAAAGAFVSLGWFMLSAVGEVHRGTVRGWAMLVGGWFVAVFAATVFARLLGVWCDRTRPK